jgi:predicted Mrr-cat superfamily restriction endonuclease
MENVTVRVSAICIDLKHRQDRWESKQTNKITSHRRHKHRDRIIIVLIGPYNNNKKLIYITYLIALEYYLLGLVPIPRYLHFPLETKRKGDMYPRAHFAN